MVSAARVSLRLIATTAQHTIRPVRRPGSATRPPWGADSVGSGSELKQVKQGVRTVIAAVVRGRLDRGRGAVALQGYNTLLRAVEIGQRDELEDLAREVEEIKRGYKAGPGAA